MMVVMLPSVTFGAMLSTLRLLVSASCPAPAASVAVTLTFRLMSSMLPATTVQSMVKMSSPLVASPWVPSSNICRFDGPPNWL